MRLQVVSGHWRYYSFSCLGKFSQFLETWRCDGSAPGHIALRFIPDSQSDASIFYRMDPGLFAGKTFSNTNCESVFFDITRTRVPSFHLVMDNPWAHPTLTRMTVYDVNVSDRAIESILQTCVCYANGDANGGCAFAYDDCAYLNGFFPVCSQCCPMALRQGHCVQLTLQILSEGLYGDMHHLRYKLRYAGMCCGSCTRHPPYASYSPQKAIAALKELRTSDGNQWIVKAELDEERCFKLAFKQSRGPQGSLRPLFNNP